MVHLKKRDRKKIANWYAKGYSATQLAEKFGYSYQQTLKVTRDLPKPEKKVQEIRSSFLPLLIDFYSL